MSDTAVKEPAETVADVESPQSESVAPDISQAYDYEDPKNVEEVDAGQETEPTSEDQESTEQAEETQAGDFAEDVSHTEGEDADAEPESKSEEGTQAPAPAFDDGLIALAQNVGITPSDAVGFASPEALRETVRFLSQKFAQQPVQQEQLQAPEPVDYRYKGETLDPEEFDPKVVKHVEGMNQHFANELGKRDQEVQELRQAMGGLMAQTQQAGRQRDVNTFDAWRERRADLRGFFGKGGMNTLKQGSQEAKDRQAVYGKAQQLAVMYRQSGEAKTADDICDEAAAIVFNNRQRSAARKEVTSKLKRKESQFLAKPSQRPSDAKNREEEAAAYVDQCEREAAEFEDKDVTF